MLFYGGRTTRVVPSDAPRGQSLSVLSDHQPGSPARLGHSCAAAARAWMPSLATADIYYMPLWQLAAAALAVGLPRAEEHGLAPSRPKDEPRDLDRLANDLKILHAGAGGESDAGQQHHAQVAREKPEAVPEPRENPEEVVHAVDDLLVAKAAAQARREESLAAAGILCAEWCAPMFERLWGADAVREDCSAVQMPSKVPFERSEDQREDQAEIKQEQQERQERQQQQEQQEKAEQQAEQRFGEEAELQEEYEERQARAAEEEADRWFSREYYARNVVSIAWFFLRAELDLRRKRESFFRFWLPTCSGARKTLLRSASLSCSRCQCFCSRLLSSRRSLECSSW